jgi:hypothetical protein
VKSRPAIRASFCCEKELVMTQPGRCCIVLLAFTLGFSYHTVAQNELSRPCSSVVPDASRRLCLRVAEAIQIGTPRVGLAFTGGNAIPGAASTIGLVQRVPRVSANARVTLLSLGLPPIARINSNTDVEATLFGFNIDAAAGIFDGVALSPTVDGFASLDLMASIGLALLPEGEGFSDGTATSWGIGMRIGILRESFTAPGISVSGMYRRVGELSYGDRQLSAEDSYFEAQGISALSLRGVVGKRLLGVGATAGLGYDRYGSDAEFGVSNPSGAGTTRFDLRTADIGAGRPTAFAALQWTHLILNIVGEVGWQGGGDEFNAPLSNGSVHRSASISEGTFYGSLAVRLTI